MMTPDPRFLHGFEKSTCHIDVAEDLEIPGLAPTGLVDAVQISPRYGAGVVDQDVRGSHSGEQLSHGSAAADVFRVQKYPRPILTADLRCRRFEILWTAGYEVNGAAF